MELHEFHVADLGAGAMSHGNAVASGNRRIGRVAVNMAQAASGEQDMASKYIVQLARLVENADSNHSAVAHQQIGGEDSNSWKVMLFRAEAFR